ncbi:MAG TPA: nickel-responsive transcriptional regulator NikR [Planctomycetaceae bacterium]|nr:nickel-responsive transcriptional regulator NikR [Planctomycetaceae bacterium]
MSTITRISISLEEELLDKFDAFSEEQGYPTRSEAMKTVIREALVREEWTEGSHVAGAISMVYDHHKGDVVRKLLVAQHDFCGEILCSQHVHLDHTNCMEIIVLRGAGERIRKLLTRLRRIKGLKHITLSMSTTGEHLN